MKILIVNTSDSGGAANACLRLHQGLLREHIDSKVLLRRKKKGLQQTFEFFDLNPKRSKFQFLKQKSLVFIRLLGFMKNWKKFKENEFINQRQKGLEIFTFPNSNFDITTSSLYEDADIIHLHWVANFLDFETFFRKNTKPVVWTLHDMNPFTGGEHYLETSLGIDESGNPIARVFSEIEIQTASKNLKLKQKAIQPDSKISIVAPSKWLVKAAQESLLFSNKAIFCIPYGIDSELFQPRDRNFSRDLLNIPKDKKVILFVADSLNNHRKGFAYLKKAFEKMEFDDVVLCVVGKNKSDLNSLDNVIELGNIDNERLMSIVYSAADVFVIPSLMDNLPNTVLEALMCGTPVIGFPVGGIPDMVNHGFNGLLTSEISSKCLLNTLTSFLHNIKDFKRDKIRNDALTKYDLRIQANRYIQLYHEILDT